ncbi:MAG: hypothetical protein K0M67_03385 [Thiobacillus sp.]|nr:hypothetical protein [Thiobacillus sp.]
MLERFWHWIRTPRAVRLAQDKRRLQRAAMDAGCSRALANRVVASYFKNGLEESP